MHLTSQCHHNTAKTKCLKIHSTIGDCNNDDLTVNVLKWYMHHVWSGLAYKKHRYEALQTHNSSQKRGIQYKLKKM